MSKKNIAALIICLMGLAMTSYILAVCPEGDMNKLSVMQVVFFAAGGFTIMVGLLMGMAD